MKQVRVKTVAESKALDVEKGIYEVWITKEVIDRGGDLVIAAGGRFESFMKNPVVQWAHRYDMPPVAKAIDLQVHAGVGVTATFQFPAVGESERADEIHRLWRGGFINASSVGFNPVKMEKMDEGDEESFWFRPPMKFLEWELLEFSLVPIPANQEALRRSLKYLQTPEQRRREKRRVKERVRSGRVAPAESMIRDDSELLLSLDQLSQNIQNLRGAFSYGPRSQAAT